MGNEKSNGIDERDEPSNDGVQHYLLRLNMCQPCHLKLHTCQGDTKATDKHQTHHCNTTLPLALHRSFAEWLPGCVSTPLPSLKCNVFYGLRQSKCRFCFFIADKSEDFIHFRFCDFFWHRRIRQGFCYIRNPQGNCARRNF